MIQWRLGLGDRQIWEDRSRFIRTDGSRWLSCRASALGQQRPAISLSPGRLLSSAYQPLIPINHERRLTAKTSRSTTRQSVPRSSLFRIVVHRMPRAHPQIALFTMTAVHSQNESLGMAFMTSDRAGSRSTLAILSSAFPSKGISVAPDRAASAAIQMPPPNTTIVTTRWAEKIKPIIRVSFNSSGRRRISFRLITNDRFGSAAVAQEFITWAAGVGQKQPVVSEPFPPSTRIASQKLQQCREAFRQPF